MQTFDRGQFLRLGAASAGAAFASGALVAGPAAAALPRATPQGDDVGFIQVGAAGELVSLAFYRQARHAKVLSGPQRRRAAAARDRKLKQLAQLNAVLGASDAVTSDTFTVTLPARAFTNRTRLAKLGERLEGLLSGVYLSGVQNAEDRSTRLLLGRLLAADVQQLAWLRRLAGTPSNTEVPAPITVQRAGARLDHYLTTPGVAPA